MQSLIVPESLALGYHMLCRSDNNHHRWFLFVDLRNFLMIIWEIFEMCSNFNNEDSVAANISNATTVVVPVESFENCTGKITSSEQEYWESVFRH